jgi:hypothetical protein
MPGIKSTDGKPIKIMESEICSTRLDGWSSWVLTYRAAPGGEMSFLRRLEIFLAYSL